LARPWSQKEKKKTGGSLKESTRRRRQEFQKKIFLLGETGKFISRKGKDKRDKQNFIIPRSASHKKPHRKGIWVKVKSGPAGGA